MIEKFEEKIHDQKDVHHIMTLHEHILIIHLEYNLLFSCKILIYMDMYKYGNEPVLPLKNNPHKRQCDHL
jgi:hypothetical protein